MKILIIVLFIYISKKGEKTEPKKPQVSQNTKGQVREDRGQESLCRREKHICVRGDGRWMLFSTFYKMLYWLYGKEFDSFFLVPGDRDAKALG